MRARGGLQRSGEGLPKGLGTVERRTGSVSRRACEAMSPCDPRPGSCVLVPLADAFPRNIWV